MVHIISGSLTFFPAKPHHRYLGGYADTEQEAVPDPRAGRYVEFHLSHIVPAADEAAVESFDDGGEPGDHAAVRVPRELKVGSRRGVPSRRARLVVEDYFGNVFRNAGKRLLRVRRLGCLLYTSPSPRDA